MNKKIKFILKGILLGTFVPAGILIASFKDMFVAKTPVKDFWILIAIFTGLFEILYVIVIFIILKSWFQNNLFPLLYVILIARFIIITLCFAFSEKINTS